MHTPSAHGLLDAWERGQGRDKSWRGLLLLYAAFPDRPEEELTGLALGLRNRLLLGLRIRLFGRELDGLATCGACGETLETQLPLSSPTGDDALALPAPGSPAEVHELRRDGWTVRYRLPTTGDVMELPAGDVEDSARWLLLRCIVAVDRDGRQVPAAEIPDDVAGGVVETMSELDPDGVVELVVACPQCGGISTVPLEPAAFLWAELDQWAWRVLGEVRDLASAFGWSENEILALSPWRRQAYLELLPA